ncbi:MAG: acylphosphatase [Prolixibacteraceae bacterium]|jgi:acylphosphatase|nr:acylphosphatase [Prolixibacteraceae bacterium]NLO03252.1 acylphosphatase [Bacteroidales bacterium]
MLQYEITITGRVQGVGFRYFVQRVANDHNIKGWVQNSRDRVVIISAQGEEIDLDAFIDHIRIGPPLARIKNFIKKRVPVSEFPEGFRIKY